MTVMSQRLSARHLRVLAATMLGIFLFSGWSTTSALANENVPFEEVGGDKCFMFSLLVPHKMEGNYAIELPFELIIDNEEDYSKLFDPKIMLQSCSDIDLSSVVSNIDFSKQTVLGLWRSGSCAAAGFEKKVIRDDINKSIIYSISVRGSIQACMGPGPQSLNLIAIPKVPAGYNVVFEKIPK